jgi:hypothetical protein
MAIMATAAVAFLAGAAGTVEPESPARVTAVWTDMAGCAADRLAMEASVGDALAPLRVTVVWKRGGPFEAVGPGAVRVVVIRSRKSALDPATMGSSNPGSASPTIWVQYDNVLRTLGVADTRGRERVALGIAVGRVIAHELVHLLAPGRDHDRTGLFAPRLDARALLSPATRLSSGFVGWYRARVSVGQATVAASVATRAPSVASGVAADAW